VSAQDRPGGYYTLDFTPVTTFADADLIVVQAALDRGRPNAYQQAFADLVEDVRRLGDALVGGSSADIGAQGMSAQGMGALGRPRASFAHARDE